jgi:lipopolysaccharide kinase (Kdo/WaaP) family protein
MPVEQDYRIISVGGWRIALLAAKWSAERQRKVLELVEGQKWAKHPQTIPLQLPSGDFDAYLKVFHRAPGVGAFKDVFKASKAIRAWRQGMALSRAGFGVPLTIAAGERRFGTLQQAFLLTEKIDGLPAHLFLRGWIAAGDGSLAAKRAGLRRLAASVRQFHRLGFVHGDLVASNIFVSNAGGRLDFYFMDNDRTRQYPSWLRQRFWRRNLIQLNRMPLPGITLQDRMRFFHAYLNSRKLTDVERRFARWLEAKTRRRRQECDGVNASGDFRRLMRWPADSGL